MRREANVVISISKEKCTGCGACVDECTMGLINMKDGRAEMSADVCMQCGHCFAVCPAGAVTIGGYEGEEYENSVDISSVLDPEKLLCAMKSRRSIRNFTKEKVGEEDIAKILEAIKYAPTARNTQQVNVNIIEDRLPEFTHFTMKILNGLPDNIPAGAPEDVKERIANYVEKWKNMLKKYEEKDIDRLFFKAPVVFVISAKSDIDGAIAAAYAEFMINSLGLGCVYVGFVKLAAMDKRVNEFLNIEDGYNIACTLAVGHPNVKFRRTAQRRDRKIIRM